MPRLNMPPERLSELVAERTMAKWNRDVQFAALVKKAYEAGYAAGEAIRPDPMVVVNADGSKPWFVPEGACGFAWVNVRPGNSAFANYLKAKKLASPAYRGGVQIWVSEFNQSVDRKEAMAMAMARVFNEAGFNAYAGSRLD